MSQPSVVIVDSNPDGLELYRTALALEGIEAATATSADEAMGHLEDGAALALVTGLRLPGTGGTDLIRQVRRTGATSDIFIVALSTNDEMERRSAREAGCDVVLRVPCLPETLVGELRRALS